MPNIHQGKKQRKKTNEGENHAEKNPKNKSSITFYIHIDHANNVISMLHLQTTNFCTMNIAHPQHQICHHITEEKLTWGGGSTEKQDWRFVYIIATSNEHSEAWM